MISFLRIPENRQITDNLCGGTGLIAGSSVLGDSDTDDDKPLASVTASVNKRNLQQSVNISDSDDDKPLISMVTTRSGRKARQAKYVIDSDEAMDDDDYKEEIPPKDQKNASSVDDLDFDLDSSDEEMLSKSYNGKVSSSTLSNVVCKTPTKPSALTVKPVLPSSVANASVNKLQAFASPRAVKPAASATPKRVVQEKAEADGRFSFLVNVRDGNGHPPDDPEYDPRTLYIPPSYWKKFTPFEKQFWEIKSQCYDTVVFFKKGKFYELYEDDASIGHQQFDLKLTDRVNMKMVGVPESTFDFWAAKFIAKGYKVAKVEQVESALGKSLRERNSKGPKEDSIIRRELTSILTGGTLVDAGLLTNDLATYCLAIKETLKANDSGATYGIAFVDTSTAEFQLCSFEDDRSFTQLETLIMQVRPREIVYEKSKLSLKALKIITDNVDSVIKNALTPGVEFWDATTTLEELRTKNYFGQEAEWPAGLRDLKSCPHAVSAFGGLVSYLRTLKIEQDLLTLKNVHHYRPMESSTTMVLDGQSLHNLEVLQNNSDGSDTGTIHALLNHCVTPFGKREFRKWLCHPLRSVTEINTRLDALEDINENSSFRNICTRLADLPDLERILSRIHVGSVKISDLLDVVAAFREILAIMGEIKAISEGLQSQLLLDIVNRFPDISEPLSFFETAFDHELARKEGTVVPFQGVEADFDDVVHSLKETEARLDDFLKLQRRTLKSSKIVYKDIGKELYQLEVPASINVPTNWIKLSGTKAVRRFRTPETAILATQVAEFTEMRAGILRSVQSRIYVRFDEHYVLWLSAVKRVATLDCLMSLAKSATLMGEPCVRPELVPIQPGLSNMLDIQELRHPCANANNNFIPNDTILGGRGKDAKPNMILLTGPNMGGKSTLLRQTCVAIIMAQVGCYVPARRCRLTPFDRIFTRIGANDNILAGQSTFMVELDETSKIIKEATPQSLVILDELGRGTSTFDGYAIALAVLYYLCTQIRCPGLFSTHYGMLTEELRHHPNLALMHMDCLVDANRRDVTFLYKLTQGVCPKSYGMNVASMAGLPSEIIDRAEAKAQEFEKEHSTALSKILTQTNTSLSLALQADLALVAQFAASPETNISPHAVQNAILHLKNYLQL
ncbi:DNA mismatch repair protein msh6, variant 2 [Entomophthora muscae]|uniref:DNA mismatch repair protein msh6, variant 2 n=1 Tax=Entomophthora muscae TaxID=34485 RepID=A0ACC2TLH8_9FUNG|nr:DNA mismatch repair protein msh6, variant 2 [Entomophthora muscae]